MYINVLSILGAIPLFIISVYSLSHSCRSIPKLRRYEDRAEKSAEWSNVVEKRLWATRYTVTAGFVTTAISLCASVFYLLSDTHTCKIRAVVAAACLAFMGLRTSEYMRDFWADKHKIPLMDEYNDAVSHTVHVMGLSGVLGMGWGVMAAIKTWELLSWHLH
ncbi:hypothetical protein B0T19DRAFT_86797 [Cercophora scortea]|uniref:Uncharacterized protein n=1 Tax=Cercophora scortea TaxID=314031 RepID=A0AAE0IVB2_9PEZI|nr:hypothetical protein B0T19DRAFT_86797 [Cercophora scortea]